MRPIETERLLLRPFRRRDAAAASYNSARPIVAHFMSDMILKTRREALRWIRWVNRDKFDVNVPCVVLAVTRRSDKNCIGLIGVAPKRELGNEIEILFAVADEHQNKGYITEAARALVEWAFAHTRAPYLVAIVKRDNPASGRVVEKLGFTRAGERRIDYDGEMTDFHYHRQEKPCANIN